MYVAKNHESTNLIIRFIVVKKFVIDINLKTDIGNL